jgi:hypothetical protein
VEKISFLELKLAAIYDYHKILKGLKDKYG